MAAENRETAINIKITSEHGMPLPEYKTPGSSGLDVRAVRGGVIKAGKWAIISTGLHVEIPKGYEIQVRSRSGLAFRQGIFVMNSPGTIDSDYRGEIKIILANFSENDFVVRREDRVAQLVVSKVEKAKFIPVENISDTVRGVGGFGHTGIDG